MIYIGLGFWIREVNASKIMSYLSSLFISNCFPLAYWVSNLLASHLLDVPPSWPLTLPKSFTSASHPNLLAFFTFSAVVPFFAAVLFTGNSETSTQPSFWQCSLYSPPHPNSSNDKEFLLNQVSLFSSRHWFAKSGIQVHRNSLTFVIRGRL